MALIEELKSQGDFLFKYRGTLPIVILLFGLGVFIYEIIFRPDQMLGEQYWYVCLGVGLLGQLVRAYTVGHTPAKTSGRNTEEQLAETLNTSGIYSTVRHPLYVGNFLMWLAVGMLTQNVWFMIAFVFAYWVYYERIMFAEEAFLRGKFGQQYEEWAAGRPAFWPKLSNFNQAHLAFSWKKVIRKEKNGFAALFILFWLFDFVQGYLSTGSLEISYNFWFKAMVASVAYYVIIKIIQKTTNLLKAEGR